MKEIMLLQDNELYKTYHESDDMWREYLALLACRCRWVQEVKMIDVLNNTINFVYYGRARDFLSFDDSEEVLSLQLLPDIIRAISHCHNNGWVHGDIKPSNILYFPQENAIRLIDFSAAQRIGTDRGDLVRWQVTPQYSNIERCCGNGVVKTQDDWFSLMKMTQQARHKSSNERVIALLDRVHAWLNGKLM